MLLDPRSVRIMTLVCWYLCRVYADVGLTTASQGGPARHVLISTRPSLLLHMENCKVDNNLEQKKNQMEG